VRPSQQPNNVYADRNGDVYRNNNGNWQSRDSKGNKQTSYYHYTVCLINLPESQPHIPELYCQRKFGLRALEKLEDAFRGSKQRVELESAALDDRYEIDERTTLTMCASRPLSIPPDIEALLRYGRGPALPPSHPAKINAGFNASRASAALGTRSPADRASMWTINVSSLAGSSGMTSRMCGGA